MKLVYPAIFTPDEGNSYSVVVPDLPGCITYGNNLVEAIEMGIDAASGWILTEIEEGHDYPRPSNPSKVDAPEGSFLSTLVLDMDSYARKYGKRAVRRNITIPAWQDSYIQEKGLSLSRIVQECILNLASK